MKNDEPEKRKKTDLGKHLSLFLTRYLETERGFSKHTIGSYSQTFSLFLPFVGQIKKCMIDDLSLADIDANMVTEFLNWTESERECLPSTRNIRLSAIKSFYHYIVAKEPKNLERSQEILSIPLRKHQDTIRSFLTVEGMKLLLKQPNLRTKNGRRDFALLGLTYDCAARVQEIIDLTPSSMSFGKQPTVKLIGKGGKGRVVPLMKGQIDHLRRYMSDHDLMNLNSMYHPLFTNYRGEKFTRGGIAHILKKYVSKARKENPEVIPQKISVHSLRHSRATHLAAARVNIIFIRDLLGHSSVITTERYIKILADQHRDELERTYPNITPDNPSNDPKNRSNDSDDSDLLDLLKSLT